MMLQWSYAHGMQERTQRRNSLLRPYHEGEDESVSAGNSWEN